MGIPVIVTGFGGHTDFATTSTAWLIDYAFAPAVTHLSVPGSCWVEPKAAHLSQLMRVAWSESRTPCRARQRRIARARNTSWTLTRRRRPGVVHKFAARIVTDGAQRSSNTCRLAWMSTWHVNCGIAEYSRYLLQHISPDLFRTTVFADLRSEVTLSPPPTIRPVWSANEPSIIKTFDQIRHGGFDAVCIQHNFAFFGFDAVHCDALVKLQKKAPVFLTLHATRPLMSYDRDHLEVAKRALGSLARLIVHTTADLNILKTVGLVDNVVMIPQGVPERLP